MGQDHDSGYKDIFSHPEMVRDLLTAFVGGEWMEQVDFETLERVNASYVSDRGDSRHDDMVWKVRLAGEWLYVYVLLEFQSQPDRWMALRILVYVGLLYQDLVKRGELSPQGKLPPVLPVVLYNGKQRWTGATDLGGLVLPAPKGLEKWQPAQGYLLIDENTLDFSSLDSRANLAAALFRLERSRTPEDLLELIVSFDGWFAAQEQRPLRQSLRRWILRILRRQWPKGSIPEVADLLEIDTMLEETVEGWVEEWKRQGLELGRAQGREQGIEFGLAKGRLEGEAQLLCRLLQRRFGDLPAWVEARLALATERELIYWGEELLDAPTLDTLFRS